MRLKFPILVGMLVAVLAPELSACKYSVRDVGFAVLRPSPYRLFVCTRSDTPRSVIAAVERVMPGVFADTNVKASVVNLDDSDKPAIDPSSLDLASLVAEANVDSLPALVLVSPDNRTTVVPLSVLREGLTDELVRKQLESVVESPIRDRVFSRILDAHSVVLVVNGNDSAANANAGEMVRSAAERVRKSMDFLPKPIGQPPEIIEITPQEAAAERILLWSLGIEDLGSPEAQVAVLFGRGRKLGEIMRVPGTTETQLAQTLHIVGQDCECELDRAWMDGVLVPHRWGEEEDTRALQVLGIDFGNPLVQMEMRAILNKGPRSGDGPRPTPLDPLPDYQEIEIISLDDLVQPSHDAPKPTGENAPGSGAADAAPADEQRTTPPDPKPDEVTIVLPRESSASPLQSGESTSVGEPSRKVESKATTPDSSASQPPTGAIAKPRSLSRDDVPSVSPFRYLWGAFGLLFVAAALGGAVVWMSRGRSAG